MIGKRVSCSYYLRSFTNDDLITFLSLPNAMVRLAQFPTAISTISPSPKTLCLILSPMTKSAIYLFLLIYANITRMANMMMTIICTGMPNMGYQSLYLCNASNCYYDSKNNPSYCHFILVRFDDSRYSHA